MAIKHRKFKEKLLQTFYDNYRRDDPPPESRHYGSAANAYYVGRYHYNPSRPFAVKGSPAYAAWAAGIDNYREAQAKVINK